MPRNQSEQAVLTPKSMRPPPRRAGHRRAVRRYPEGLQVFSFEADQFQAYFAASDMATALSMGSELEDSLAVRFGNSLITKRLTSRAIATFDVLTIEGEVECSFQHKIDTCGAGLIYCSEVVEVVSDEGDDEDDDDDEDTSQEGLEVLLRMVNEADESLGDLLRGIGNAYTEDFDTEDDDTEDDDIDSDDTEDDDIDSDDELDRFDFPDGDQLYEVTDGVRRIIFCAPNSWGAIRMHENILHAEGDRRIKRISVDHMTKSDIERWSENSIDFEDARLRGPGIVWKDY